PPSPTPFPYTTLFRSGPGQPMARFSMKDLGIGFAILAYSPPKKQWGIQNPNYAPPVGGAGIGLSGPGGPGLGALGGAMPAGGGRSEEHTSELQSLAYL